MNAKLVVPLSGLCALLLVAWAVLWAGRGSSSDVLEFNAEVLVRVQEAHFLDFYGYTAQMDRLGFAASKHVLVQTELSPDRLGWSGVLMDDRLPGRGCAVFGGKVDPPLSSPGGLEPSRAGVPVCDPPLEVTH